MERGPLHLVVVSAVVMGIAQTVAKEKVFEPLRARLGGKETWLGYLVSCPYCVSHWLAFALVPLTGAFYVRVVPRWGLLSDVLDWFLSSILVVVVAAFLRVGFWLVDESQGLVRRRQKTEEETTRLVREQAEKEEETTRLVREQAEKEEESTRLVREQAKKKREERR